MTTSTFVCRRGIALALLVLLPACYSYVPLETGPTAGQDVRVHLTDEGRGQPGVQGSATSEGTIDGLVLRSKPDSVTLSTSSRAWRTAAAGARDTLTLATSSVSRIDVSRLDKPRTFVLAALGAGAIVAAVILVAHSDLTNTGGGGGGGGGNLHQGIRIPLTIP
ncbi:MAG TPA: hypothetical protein VKB18_00890 [Gemmatimonadota bacterium]|nr:hypothetical protein [Gemmatimonadota bacterium]